MKEKERLGNIVPDMNVPLKFIFDTVDGPLSIPIGKSGQLTFFGAKRQT